MGAKQSTSLKNSPSKGNIKSPGYLASVLYFLEPGDGVTELEAYLRANPNQQLNVAQELANQSTDSQFRRNVVTLGALRILRLLTISHEHNVVLCAIHALGNLAVDTDNHDDMVHDGCFYNIIDLLSSGKVDLQCKAARAITNLCVTYDNKHHFDQLGAVGALIHLAQHSEEKCRTEAVAALGNLSVDDTLEMKIVQQGGIEAVHACLGKGDRVLQEHAERAIRNLTMSEQNKQYYAAFLQRQQTQQVQAQQKAGHSQHLSRDLAASVGNWFEGGGALNAIQEEKIELVEDSDTSSDSDNEGSNQSVLMTRGGNVAPPPTILATPPSGPAPEVAPPNQQGWRQLMDPSSQQPYWYNVHTQESRWAPPLMAAPRPPAASTPTPANIPQRPALSFAPTHQTTPNTASSPPTHPSRQTVVNVPPPRNSPSPPSVQVESIGGFSSVEIDQALAALPQLSPTSGVRRGHGRAGTVVEMPKALQHSSPPPQQLPQQPPQQPPQQSPQQPPPSSSPQMRHKRAHTVAPPSHDHPSPPTVHQARPPSAFPPPLAAASVVSPSVPPPRVPAGLPPASPSKSPSKSSPVRTRLPSRPIALPSEPHPEERLSMISKQVINAINMVRTAPSEFIQCLKQMRMNVGKDNILRTNIGSVQTTEGTLAYDEAIAFLTHMKPMSTLEISTSMCNANLSHAEDLGASGATGHEGSDGSRAAQRLRRNGGVIAGGGRVSEGIEFGPWVDGEDFVVSLVVGDGEASRTQRKILLDPASGACGVGVAQHKHFGSVCVVTLAPNCAKVDSNTFSPSNATKSSASSRPKVHQRKNTMQLAQSMSLPNNVVSSSSPIHQRANTMQLAQSLSLPSVLEGAQEHGATNVRRNTMQEAANVPLGS